MKKIKYLKVFLACSLFSFVFASCTEDTMDKINRDKDNPLDVEARFLIPELITSSAFSVAGGDLSTYASVYIEHEGGAHNQMYYADKRLGEPISTTTYNNSWRSIYSNIMLAKVVIDKCTNGEDKGNDIILGIAKVLLAYNSAVATDLFGDTPYAEAGIIDENMIPVYRHPKVDKQEDIYKNIFTLLDEAIAIFSSSETSDLIPLSNNDYIYGGDKSKWLKAAYGLKARYTMRLLARSANKTADLNNILSYIGKSFTSSSEEFKFKIYDGSAQNNPLYSFSISRRALGVSKSYADKLRERNDPRLTQMFMNRDSRGAMSAITDLSKLTAFENGVSPESQTAYSLMISDYAPTAPTQLMSYHELLYLKAEAYARLGDNPMAKIALKDALGAGFANLEISLESSIEKNQISGTSVDLSATVSNTYFTASVEPLFDAYPLKEIMIQKYLAFAGASGESIESYNDYRRLQGANENFITLANPNNADNKFPLRYIYGGDDVSSNPNIRVLIGDGTYVYKEKVWWAGGDK